MAINTKITNKPGDTASILAKDTNKGLNAVSTDSGLQPLMDEDGNPIQLAGTGTELIKNVIKGAAKKVAPKTTKRLEKSKIVKKEKEAEIEATEKAVLDEIQAETPVAPVVNQAAEEIVTPTLPEQIRQQVEKRVQQPETVFDQFDALEDLEGFLTKNASISIEKQGSVSVEKTNEEALKSFSDTIDIPSTVLAQNGILNSTQIQKAFNIMVELQEQNHKTAQLISNPSTRTPELELKLREGLMKEAAVRKYFLGARSEVGRTLNIFKNLKKLVKDDPSLLTSETIEREFGGEGANIANGYINAYNNSKATGHLAHTAKYAEGTYGQRVWNAIMSHYYFNMLASPKTQMINMLGNASFAGMSIPEYYVAGLFTKLNRSVATLPALVGGKKITQALLQELEGSIEAGEAQARFLGMMHAMPYAFRLGVHSFKTGERSTGRSQIGDDTTETILDRMIFKNKVPERNNEFDAITGDKLIPSPLKDKPGMNALGKFIDYWGTITSVPGRGLLSGDEFFKEVARQMELFSLAERARIAAIRNGKTAEEAENAFIETLANPGNNLKPRLDQAADYFTFQNQLDYVGKNLKHVQKLPGGRLIVPFFNVVYNIGKVIFGYTPGPNLFPLAVEEYKFFANALQTAYPETMAKWTGMRSQFERDPTKRTLWEARVATSVAILAGVYYLMENGHMIGSTPKDKKDKAAFYDAGKEPFSFVFKDGDWEGPKFDENGLPNGALTYRRFIGFEPIAGVLGINIAALEQMARYQTQDPDDPFYHFIPMSLVAATYDYVTEWPLVKGFAELMETIIGPTYSKFSDDPENIKFDKLLSGIGKNIIGGGTVGQQVGNIMDPTLRISQPDFEQDLTIFLGDVTERKVNPDFGTFDDNTMANQFESTIDQIYANYVTETKPARADIFNKPYTKDSGRGWIGNIRNSFLPFAVYDREELSDTYKELLRLHAVTKNMSDGKNLLMRKKKHNLMGVIGLNQIQTAFFYELTANTNGELKRYGKFSSLEKSVTRLMKSPEYKKPKLSQAFIEWTDGTYAGMKQFGLEDEYRIHLIEKEVSDYMTAATAAYVQLDKKNNGKIYQALKTYFIKTNAEQPREFDQFLNLKN